MDNGSGLTPIEIKSGQTVAADFLTSLRRWCELPGDAERPALLVYGGSNELKHENVTIIPWRKLAGFFAPMI